MFCQKNHSLKFYKNTTIYNVFIMYYRNHFKRHVVDFVLENIRNVIYKYFLHNFNLCYII